MKKIKGFTLVELIIVMFILTILMTAIMNMMKPIRSTFLDSTYYEAQRNTQSGMAQYIAESVRYATNLGVYTEGKTVSGATPASIGNVREAIDQFMAETGVVDETKINVITIDNKTAYTYNNAKFYGRIIRTKPLAAGDTYDVNKAAAANTDQARLALGAAYYGDSTYSINITPTDKGLKIQVSSLSSDSLKNAEKSSDRDVTIGDISGQTLVSTEAEAACYNVTAAVSSPGKFSKDYAGTTTTAGKNTYIVFTLPE